MSGRPSRFDAVVIGGGHNGLVCAAYLAGAGLEDCELVRRSVLGGAAVTDVIRASAREMLAERQGLRKAKGERKPKGESESRLRAPR